MKKIFMLLGIILIIGAGSTYYFGVSNVLSFVGLSSGDGKVLFSKKDIHPLISAKLNEEFGLNLGQVASFDEGFKIMFVGYISGCEDGSSLGKYLKGLILKRAEASQCDPSPHPIFSMIQNGVVYLGSHEIYMHGYQVLNRSSDYNPDKKFFTIKVIPVEKKELEKAQTEEKNRQLERQAKQELKTSYCMEISEKVQKENCMYFIARETYMSEGYYPSNIDKQILKVREICNLIGYENGFCLILGKEKVATPEMCTEWEKRGKANPDREWRGSSFYEDCNVVSKQYYKVQ